MSKQVSYSDIIQNIKSWVSTSYDKLDQSGFIKLFVYSNLYLYTLLMTCWILRMFWVI